MHSAVQVWQIPLRVSENTLAEYFECLDPDEKARADRFRFLDDRRRFVVARGALRHLLARELKCAPDAVEFYYGKYGKPMVESLADRHRDDWSQRSCSFHFNLTHSGELALCAVGYERAVGVDIEKMKPMKRLESMMERCLSAVEQAQVEAEAECDRTRAFLQRWTCKEAYLKAVGLGLTQSMQTVEVDVIQPRLVQVPEQCAEGWHLAVLALPDEYVGALVVAGQAVVHMQQWEHL